MTSYEVTARNYSEASENRIHSDEVARKYGFSGALVPGVAVYGHLTYPFVNRSSSVGNTSAADTAGEAWLSRAQDHLRLLKPAYHEDRLLLELQAHGSGQQVTCVNQQGDTLATLLSPTVPDDLLAGEPRPALDGDFKLPQRILIEWDNIHPGQPFVPWEFTISAEENQRYTREVDDSTPVYQQYAHPHLLCSLANTALMNEYIMPTWLHVGTSSHRHQALYVGDTITVRSVPMARWQNKGHEFIKLYVSYWRERQLTTELLHTAIYRVAG